MERDRIEQMQEAVEFAYDQVHAARKALQRFEELKDESNHLYNREKKLLNRLEILEIAFNGRTERSPDHVAADSTEIDQMKLFEEVK